MYMLIDKANQARGQVSCHWWKGLGLNIPNIAT